MLRNGCLESRTDEDLDTFSFSVWKSCLGKIWDFEHMFRMSVCMPFSLVKKAAALPLTRLWYIWKSQISLLCTHKPFWRSTYPVSWHTEETSQHPAYAVLMIWKTTPVCSKHTELTVFAFIDQAYSGKLQHPTSKVIWGIFGDISAFPLWHYLAHFCILMSMHKE